MHAINVALDKVNVLSGRITFDCSYQINIKSQIVDNLDSAPSVNQSTVMRWVWKIRCYY